MKKISVKKILMLVIGFAFLFNLSVTAMAYEIPVSNEVYVFEAGEFQVVDGWYVGEINVKWHGNANKRVEFVFEGNQGEIIVTPFTVVDHQQREGTISVKIAQTTMEQTVTFTLEKNNTQKLNTSIIVPALFNEQQISFDVLRTASNPGYYFSGALIHMGVTLTAGDVNKNTFNVKAKVTEYDGSIQGSFGNYGWDPEKESYALGDGWAKWNIVDAYVSDADGNRVEKGDYVKIENEWITRTEPSGASSANRYDVPATRAAWYTGGGYISYASIELDITQNVEIPGIATAAYVQNETRHDPIFDRFEISDELGGGSYALYTPDNASEDNKRPILVWFHGTGERYHGANPGGNLIGNRVLAFADTEFQTILEGCYVLAPQSRTDGWSVNRLNDMEALIKKVVEENHVDPNRIYVGGLSMGTGMTTPLITSLTENKIDFAAAILCSGGNINPEQAQIIASKGFPVYLVGNTSDFAAGSHPTSLENLINAGVDAKMKRYPEGPVFDGSHYFGAHDSWNYIYNNMVEDENGETIFEWLAKQSRKAPNAPSTLVLTTNKPGAISKGEYFTISASLTNIEQSNTSSITFTYDPAKYVYRGFTEAEGLTEFNVKQEEGSVTIILGNLNSYDLLSIGTALFSAREDVDLTNEESTITARLDLVTYDGNQKVIKTLTGYLSFSTVGVPGDTDGDRKITLLDLSNLIDYFGITSTDQLWITAKFFDFNHNGQIDINDISFVATRIE